MSELVQTRPDEQSPSLLHAAQVMMAFRPAQNAVPPAVVAPEQLGSPQLPSDVNAKSSPALHEPAIAVGVFVAEFVGVLVRVFVAVFVGVLVGVFVGVLVGVFVGVLIGVFVGVGRRQAPWTQMSATAQQVFLQACVPTSHEQRRRPVWSGGRHAPEQQSASLRQTPPPWRQVAAASDLLNPVAPTTIPPTATTRARRSPRRVRTRATALLRSSNRDPSMKSPRSIARVRGGRMDMFPLYHEFVHHGEN